MANTVTLRLTKAQVFSLLDGLEAKHLPYLDDDELKENDQLIKRLERAAARLNQA